MASPGRSPGTNPGHDAFISYSRRDSDFARKLNRALEEYRPPKGLDVPQRNLQIFRDEEDFTGVEYHAAVRQHLESSAKLLVLCSPNSRKSEYVGDEIRHFAETNGAQNIIPILVSGIANNEAAPGQDDQMAFPAALCAALQMPLAIDYRKFDLKKDKLNKGVFRGPWYTILANVYGTSRDRIEEREKAREARRRRLTRSIVTGVIAILASALVITLFFWRQAVEQRRIAVARQLAAQAELVRNQRAVNIELSTLLAVESTKRAPSLEADLVLRPDLALLARLVAVFSHGAEVYQVAFSPDRKYVATSSAGDLKVFELASGRQLAHLHPSLPIGDIAFSSDGEHLATASGSVSFVEKSYAAQVWKWRDGQEVSQMEHEEPVNKVIFSPNGEYLASIDAKKAHLWEARNGRPLVELTHEHMVTEVAFSPNGNRLATGTNRGLVRIFSVPDGRELVRMEHQGSATGFAFSPDSMRIALPTEGGIQIIEVDTGRELVQMPHAGDRPTFSPGGEELATLGRENAVIVWDSETGRELARMHHNEGVADMAFSPDGKNVATAVKDDTARIWTTSGKEVTRMVHRLAGFVGFGPNGRHLATVSLLGEIRWWEMTDGHEGPAMPTDGLVFAIQYSPDGKFLATNSRDNFVRVWEAVSGRELMRVADEYGAHDMALSPNDGKYLAIASADRDARIVDPLSGRDAFSLPGVGKVQSVEFTKDGKYLATAGFDYHVRVWEIPSGRQVADMPHADSIGAISLSPDGKYLATFTTNTGTVVVWETVTARELVRMKYEGSLASVAFSPDGKYLAAAVLDKENATFVWEARTGREVSRLIDPEGVVQIAFSPDGKHLAAAVLDGTARMWSITTGKEVARFRHLGQINSIAFNADGTYLGTASSDGTSRIWEPLSGREVARLPAAAAALAFSPDDQHLATGGADSAQIWVLRPEDLIKEACTRLTRNLTQDEWRQYVGNEPYSPTCENLKVGHEIRADLSGKL